MRCVNGLAPDKDSQRRGCVLCFKIHDGGRGDNDKMAVSCGCECGGLFGAAISREEDKRIRRGDIKPFDTHPIAKAAQGGISAGQQFFEAFGWLFFGRG